MVKHKSEYSCKSVIYFDISPDITKENCKFTFNFNKTDITLTVCDGGNNIVLANWPDDKHIICNVNNNIAVKIPSHPYVLLNRSILCNCSKEAENMESLAACHDSNSKLLMYFMVNTAFVNYLDSLDNLTDYLKFPILMSKTTFEQTLPISLKLSKFYSKLLTSPMRLKDFVHQYFQIFDLQERHTNMESEMSNKNLSFNNYTIHIFLFVTAIILILVTSIVLYILFKHIKLKPLVTSLALQQIKEVGAVTKQEGIMLNKECNCKIQWYTILILSFSIWVKCFLSL